MNYNNTLYYGVSKTQIGTYPQIQSVSSIANNALNIANNANANANTKVKMEIVSYVGTGTYGVDNPTSLVSSFPIKLAIFLLRWIPSLPGYSYASYSAGYSNIFVPSLASTSYTEYLGFGEYISGTSGKISSDKKTITWYNTQTADRQNNISGITYYYLILG